MILYRIVTTQHLDTDTVYQLYRTSLLFTLTYWPMKCVINMCIHTYTQVHIHACANKHTHSHRHTHTQTYIHRHTHTYTHTNTHTQTQQTHNTYTCARTHTDVVSHSLCYHKREKMCWAKLSQFSRVLQNVSHEYKRLPLIILDNKNFWLR